MVHLATAVATLGQRDTGVSLLAEAIRMAAQTHARFFLAELYRLRGDLLVEHGRPGEGEADLQSALAVARGQQARLWELRAASSIARLLGTQELHAHALEPPLPVYHRVTESFETAHLTAAMRMPSEHPHAS